MTSHPAPPRAQEAAPAAPAVGTPRPEYPRPDRDRSDRWLTLNGTWELETPEGTVPVVVPFAWETAASGVRRTWLEHATYRRTLTVPGEWAGARVFLCFGAVHHHARVLVDDVMVAEHTGGSVPFEVELAEGLAGRAARLAVEVEAPSDKRQIPHGKQRSIPRDDYDGVSFTPTSGIWQSVWLEARGRTWVAAASLRGDSLTGFDVSGRLAGDAPGGTRVGVRVLASHDPRAGETARMGDDGTPGGLGTGRPAGAGPGAAGAAVVATATLVAAADGTFVGRVELAEPRPWSPADPYLYRVVLSTAGTDVQTDRVALTAGLRRIEVRGEELFLNGERLYLRGVLDQGYWPGSGLTAPDDAALVADLELARDAGYTLVRKHIKLEEPRWLHHADRLGLLVWAEPPAPSRFSAQAAEAFEAQLAPMVERDGNHPSIVVWGLYNEEWGLDWDIPGSPERAAAAGHAYDALRALDPTRPVVENSGWNHVRSDLVDWHYYDEDPAAWAANVAGLADGSREDFPVRLGPDFVVDKSLYGSRDFPRTGVPVLNSEYGAGFTSLERAWHLRWQTQELRRHGRFAGYVYTELADVEHELAGLVDADRRPKDLGGLWPADVNADTVLVVDLVPARAGADLEVPASVLGLDVHVSHHGAEPVVGRVCAAWVPSGTPFPAVGVGVPATATTDAVKVEPYVLSPAVRLDVPPPGDVGAARLLVWLADDADAVLARTFVDAAPIEPPNRRGARA